MPRLQFVWAGVLLSIFLFSCAEMKTLILPEGVNATFYSGDIIRGSVLFGQRPGMEYRIFSDTIVKSAYIDSPMTFGVILPISSLVSVSSLNRMNAGLKDVQCSIEYVSSSIYKSEERGSILSDILYPSQVKRIGYDPHEVKTIPLMRLVTGCMRLSHFNQKVCFGFEHASGKDFDSARIAGFLQKDADTFYIKPFFKEIPLKGKNVKPMQVLQGYCLTKNGVLVAFLQHAPMVKSLFQSGLKDRLYVSNLMSSDEQYIITTYFLLVSRLVAGTTGEALY